jgi:hypothetical protein
MNGNPALKARLADIEAMGDTWQSLATLAGVEGINHYSDPAPPPGRALYRVALLP